MDRVAQDEWHVVAALDALPLGQEVITRLLGTDLTLVRPAGDIVAAWPAASGRALPVCIRHGHVWTSLGNPARPLFDLPRPVFPAGSMPVGISLPRALEAFAESGAGQPHPCCVLTGETGLFIQPVGDKSCILHLVTAGEAGRADWQLEVARLKPILESQAPERQRRDARATSWYPLASSGDLVLRHIFHTALHGQELALWRDDSGLANVWENRCPHRGVRLTIGANLGTELRCQYHGWRFSSGSGQCIGIPARVATYPCVERYGLVWSTLDGAPEDIPDLGAVHWQPLRAMFVEAPLSAVAAELPEKDDLKLLLQPVSDHQTVIHGLSADPAILSLHRHDQILVRLRDRIEEAAP